MTPYEGLEEVKSCVSDATANKLLQQGWQLLAATGDKNYIFGRFKGRKLVEPIPGNPPVTGEGPSEFNPPDAYK